MEGKHYVKLITLESIDSTNNYAYALAEQRAKEITIIRAKTQTKGKGRLGRKWLSPKDKGIYVSFILRPQNIVSDIYYLPSLCTVAVKRTLSSFVHPYIKLPNDVVVNNKKIAGVLVEAKGGAHKGVDFVILGIGVNVNAERKELPPKATSLYLETGKNYNIDELFPRLVKEVMDIYRKFKKREFASILRKTEELAKAQTTSLVIRSGRDSVCIR